MLDLTKIVDLNAHSEEWSDKVDQYGLYGIHIVTPIGFRLDEPWNGKQKLSLSIKEGNQMFTYFHCPEAIALIEAAIAKELKVKVYASKQLSSGKYVMALSNTCWKG